MDETENPNNPITDLLTAYEELNSNIIDEFHEEPSPLEFMRYVAQNRPFVVRKGAAEWKATKCWNAEYLKEKLKDLEVNVAITPFGNADAPTLARDGSLIFTIPLEETHPFPAFLNYITNPDPPCSEIWYAQTQNDNLRGEYISLFTEVPSTIPFARVALAKEPDAINLWIGTEKSVTALHKDNYENIFVQIVGAKHFVLLPALAVAGVQERELDVGTYFRGKDGLEAKMEEGEKVPFATWDPDDPRNGGEGKCGGILRPTRVTLGEGDMLYLPAMWYHKVSQTSGEERFACSVNYWYDMEFSGSLFPLCSFARDIALSNQKRS